jgi:hypothetical protein
VRGEVRDEESRVGVVRERNMVAIWPKDTNILGMVPCH